MLIFKGQVELQVMKIALPSKKVYCIRAKIKSGVFLQKKLKLIV